MDEFTKYMRIRDEGGFWGTFDDWLREVSLTGAVLIMHCLSDSPCNDVWGSDIDPVIRESSCCSRGHAHGNGPIASSRCC